MPEYLWKLADFLQNAKNWQGTASELLAAAGIQGVRPNQLTRKLVEHYYTVFVPKGIRYESHRTSSARQMRFWCDGDDDNDGICGIPAAARGISKTSSLSSLAS